MTVESAYPLVLSLAKQYKLDEDQTSDLAVYLCMVASKYKTERTLMCALECKIEKIVSQVPTFEECPYNNQMVCIYDEEYIAERMDVYKSMDKLPAISKDVLLMYYINGLTLAEIGAKHNISTSVVHRILTQSIKDVQSDLALYLYTVDTTTRDRTNAGV